MQTRPKEIAIAVNRERERMNSSIDTSTVVFPVHERFPVPVMLGEIPSLQFNAQWRFW